MGFARQCAAEQQAAAARLASSPHASAVRRSALERELRGVEQELGRYAEAIGCTGPLPAILDALQARERRREAIQAELDALDALKRTAAVVSDVAVTAPLRSATFARSGARCSPRILPSRTSS